eukprot:TRINITY_DN2719_c0_g1_i3.p1 TRINITY_DN2719_c0_g1~~TRINITY_DN2719_c0_g1_i3.p1  ORF type:complete len:274 (+),score=81.30 TRINITY_DN2719_c0_g1_i3:193-1014(+)
MSPVRPVARAQSFSAPNLDRRESFSALPPSPFSASGNAFDASGSGNAANSLPFSLRAVTTKCVVQHLLLDLTSELYAQFGSRLSAEQTLLLFDPLIESLAFARAFDADLDLRRSLWVSGFRERQRTLPDLFRQEAHALLVYARILLTMYQQPALAPLIEPRLIALLRYSFSEFVDKDQAHRSERQSNPAAPTSAAAMAIAAASAHGLEDELRCKEAVVCTLLQGLLLFSEDQMKQHVRALFAAAMPLLECDSIAVRRALREFLAARLPPLLSV